HTGDDPGEQRQRFLDKTSLQTDQAGNDNDGDDGPIDPGESHGGSCEGERRRSLAEGWGGSKSHEGLRIGWFGRFRKGVARSGGERHVSLMTMGTPVSDGSHACVCQLV